MRFLLAASFTLLLGCGAKTGLLIPDADLPYDAGMDGGHDAGIDAPICMPQPVSLMRRGAQVLFVLDRSNSMDDTISGEDREPDDPRPSRWDVLGTTLGDVLSGGDPLLEVGAKVYPSVDMPISTPMEACMVDPNIDVAPGPGRVSQLVELLNTTIPAGGTPTAEALGAAERFFVGRPSPGVPRFIVLATDGGPNCSPDPDVPHTECVCTGGPMDCLDPTFGPYNCIDEGNTVDVITRLFGELSIPVYVIGIDDPSRPDLADVLDRMADAGGRPRDVPGARRFYSVGRRDELEGALTTITETIARCVFELSPVPPLDATLELDMDGLLIARDGTRTEGWDFTAPDRSEITLFGGACARVTGADATVSADILCEE